MDLRDLTWDYADPLEDDAWRARRLAEYFPFVAEGICREDRELLLREIDGMNLPEERKELIRIVCTGEENEE
mgnify:CR=1 FL=1